MAPPTDRRKHSRYRIGPEEPVYCQLDRRECDHHWKPVLVSDESYSGCSLKMDESDRVDVGESLRLDFGHGHMADAEVLRVRQVSPEAVEVACRFIY